MAQQGFDVHQLRPGVERMGGAIVLQLGLADLLGDAGLARYPASRRAEGEPAAG